MKTTTNYGLRKPETTDPVDIADFNENSDKIDAALKAKLDSNGDASNVISKFTQAVSRTNLVSGEALNTTLGKIMRWFTELKNIAFTGKACDAEQDVNNRFVTDAQISVWNSKTDDSTVNAHKLDKNNPHDVTKVNVGLGNCDNTSDANKPISTATQTALNNKVDKVSGKGLSSNDYDDAAKNNVSAAYMHSQKNSGNPHGVTKSDVGLGSVPNVATNDQTPSYTVSSSNAELVSGEKLSAAFGKIAKAISSLISHLANVSNPHSVTKSDVGLGNVDNKSSATIRGEISSSNVANALGYTPAKSSDLEELYTDITNLYSRKYSANANLGNTVANGYDVRTIEYECTNSSTDGANISNIVNNFIDKSIGSSYTHVYLRITGHFGTSNPLLNTAGIIHVNNYNNTKTITLDFSGCNIEAQTSPLIYIRGSITSRPDEITTSHSITIKGINYIGQRGIIKLYCTKNCNIEDCKLIYNGSGGNISIYPIYMSLCHNIHVSDVSISGFPSKNSYYYYGMYIQQSTDIQITNCNTHTEYTSIYLTGTSASPCKNIIIDNMIAKSGSMNTSATNQDCAIHVSDVIGLFINNFIVRYHPNIGRFYRGLFLNGNNYNINLSNCKFISYHDSLYKYTESNIVANNCDFISINNTGVNLVGLSSNNHSFDSFVNCRIIARSYRAISMNIYRTNTSFSNCLIIGEAVNELVGITCSGGKSIINFDGCSIWGMSYAKFIISFANGSGSFHLKFNNNTVYHNYRDAYEVVFNTPINLIGTTYTREQIIAGIGIDRFITIAYTNTFFNMADISAYLPTIWNKLVVGEYDSI